MPTSQKDYKLISTDDTNVERNQPATGISNERLPIYSRLKINRPLIPLKICLFFFFAGGAAVSPYLQLNIVQLGISVQHLSIMYMISPVMYFLGPAVSGILADKIGRAKPVFVANLILAVISLNSMLLIPPLRQDCGEHSILFDCPSGDKQIASSFLPCHAPGDYAVHKCQYLCFDDSKNGTSRVHKQDEPKYENFSAVSVLAIEGSPNDSCVYDVRVLTPGNGTVSWCSESSTRNCSVLCLLDSKEKCVVEHSEFALVFGLSLVLLMTFTTVMSNCYRMLDVTAMHMVKDHHSDFGRVRFWSILSSAILPPLAGLLVDKFSEGEGPKFYALAFYLFDIMMFITAVAVWKLDVRISPPGQKMWKKTLLLIKKPDFMAFGLVLFFLGTSWGFSKNFANVYLQSIGADSLLLGLVVATNSLAGLPFLLTSNWWVQKIGTTNILLLAFVGYLTYFFGYYDLQNPWYAIPLELTTILTYHLLWVAVVRHSHSTAPEGLTATVIASAGGIHYGIGKGSGSLIGGYVRRKDSKFRVDPLAYMVSASISTACLILYGTFLFCRRRLDRNESNLKNGDDRTRRNGENTEKLSSL